MKVKPETVGRVVGGTAGGVVLGHVGTGIGIAALGGAVAATWPLAAVGVIGGAVIGSSVGKRTKGADSETGPEHGRDPKD